MTAREFARKNGIEVVGKLNRAVAVHQEYNGKTGDYTEKRVLFYIDEAGNEFHKANGAWCIITADGGVI